MAQQDLYKLLQECTVCLNSDSGSGTGFFVAPGGWIITCDHVVAQSNYVNVLWSFGESKQELIATVKLRLSEPIDIALLQIEGKAPNHKCVYLDQSLPQIGDTLYTFGYPQDYSSASYSGGDSVTTKYEGKSFQGNVLILKLKEGQIQEGYSGSPLLNLRTRKVCGIVSISRNTASDLGGRATPITLLFQVKEITEFLEAQRLILTRLESNKKYHHNIDKTWKKLIEQPFWDRKLAVVLIIILLICSTLIYVNTPVNQIQLAILRLLLACGFGYSIFLLLKSLNFEFATARRVPINSFGGFLTTILVVGTSFLVIPDNSIVLRNLTGINEYPTFGLVEKELPLPLKKALDIYNEPIIDINNPIYEAIQAFRDESGNNSLMSKYEKPSGISSAYNEAGNTLRQRLVGRGEGRSEKIRQDLNEFESEPGRFEGEHQEFQYTTVLVPFQTFLDDAAWSAFLPVAPNEEKYKELEIGSLLQYPKLSDVKVLGTFIKSEWRDNTWIKKISDSNPDVRGFLAFTHRYLSNLGSSASSIASYLFLCGYEGIKRIAPTPYVRFVDIYNNSLSSIKIDSVRTKNIEKDKYKLTPVSERDLLFQDIPSKDEVLGISIPPGVHLLLPTEFGFDTRLSKNVGRGNINTPTGREEENRTDTSINVAGLLDKTLYISKIPQPNKDGYISRPASFDSIISVVNQFLNPITFTQDFISRTKTLRELSELVPDRFAVGTLRNIVSIRTGGKDVRADNPLNDPRFSMSVYFAYGSCPYLMIYNSQKGYWIDLGTVITGQDSKAKQSYEIHDLGDRPSKFRIEERDKEITYLDAISVLYTDTQSGENREVKSKISQLDAVDEDYFILQQDDALEVDLEKLLPSNAINVRLKIDGFYEVLPSAIPMHLPPL